MAKHPNAETENRTLRRENKRLRERVRDETRRADLAIYHQNRLTGERDAWRERFDALLARLPIQKPEGEGAKLDG